MIGSQRHLFDIPEDVAWINCAQHSPALQSVYEAGLSGLGRKRHPWTLGPAQYQDDIARLRELVARLIGAQAEDISLSPSVSYSLSLVANNLEIGPGRHALVLAEQFPSNVYPWRAAAARDGGSVVTVPRPEDGDWTAAVLGHLDERCAVLAVPECHWMDGSRLDLAQIGDTAKACGAAFILDLSQSLGVVPLDVGTLRPDFVCTVAYKWLLGPYSFGYLYSAPEHQGGQPLEQAWSSRAGSDQGASLTDYRDDFLSGARRYDVGERGNYIAVPMAIAGLEQVLAWGPAEIAASLAPLVEEIARRAEDLGVVPTPAAVRSPHFLGLRFPGGLRADLLDRLKEQKVFVSQRGDSLRISPHLYNDERDVARLFEALGGLV